MKDAKGHGSDPRGAHSQGVQQVGVPNAASMPSVRRSLQSAYRRNETMNNHSNNIVLLAKNFGTADEHAKAKEIVAERNRQGSLPQSTKSVPDVQSFQRDIHTRYIGHLE